LMRYAVVIGDGKEFLAALLILELNVVKRMAKKRKCSPKRLFASPDIQQHIRKHVDAVNKTAKCGVRKFSIVPRHLSVKRGELTCTMSIRRDVVAKSFENEIAALYREPPKGAVPPEPLLVMEHKKPKKPDEEDDPKGSAETGKKLTDGCFYRKTSTGEFRKTNLQQSVVEDMERQLFATMKEIRELAKRIKTLQEQHVEDSNTVKSKELAVFMLENELEQIQKAVATRASNHTDGEDPDGQKRAGKKASKSPSGKKRNKPKKTPKKKPASSY